jgi:hypothetical protein
MRLQFWFSMVLAVLAVSCTSTRSDLMTPRHEVAQSVSTAQPSYIQENYIRCASAEVQPQSDPCSAKTMAGQRVRR